MAIESEKMDEKTEDSGLHRTRQNDEDATASITTKDSVEAIPDQLLTSNGIPADEEAAATPPTGRARSQASSTRSRPQSIVPRRKRRGLFSQLTLIPEVERPYDYPNRIKWAITAFIALAACAAPMGSAIFYRKQLYTYFLLRLPWHNHLSLSLVMEYYKTHVNRISCASGYGQGPRRLPDSGELDSSLIYVSNVNISTLVELLLRGSRTT